MHRALPQLTSPSASPADLEAALRAAVRGDVWCDRISRTIYSTDASLYQLIPQAVVAPRDAADVQAVLRIARQRRTPLSPRGAGTGITGGALGTGICLDFSRYMTRIWDLDRDAQTVRVQPGVVLDDLNALLAPHDLFFPADVATSSRATLGGMIANNSCGAHSVMYGRTVDYVDELTVLLADGTVQVWPHLLYDDLPPREGRTPQVPLIRSMPGRFGTPAMTGRAEAASWDESALPPQIAEVLREIRGEQREEVLARYPRVLRRNGGYALDRLVLSEGLNPATLICGSEGTLGLILEARLRLVARPRRAALLVAQFDSVFEAVGATPQMLKHHPAAVELIDDLILSAGAPQILPEIRARFLTGLPRAILVCELYDDDDDRLRARMTALADDLAGQNIGAVRHVVFDIAAQAAVWDMRKRGFGLLTSRPGDRQPHEFIEDAAVDPADLRAYLEQLTAAVHEEGCTDLGYYAHASVGVIHVRPVLNLKAPLEVERLARIAERSRALVQQFGGAFTGEHGDGFIRSWSLERMYGPRIATAFAQLKAAFDPENVLNPGKIVAPPPITANLRHRPFPKQKRATYFDYGAHGGPDGLAGMCSGVGQCRQKLVGTMCPSYMATLDEHQTTRARAVALRAALEGDGLLRGLNDPALHDVMDLCLSCKACKTECPTGVDMARLKAEWLAHLYAERGAPAAARFFGNAPRAAKLGGRVPRLANWVQGGGLVRGLLENLYGLDQRIAPPTFAPIQFRKWFRKRPLRVGSRGQVVYFVDTWTNYYWPQVGVAAVKLLEAAGYQVLVPDAACCGRPLISKGLLAEARRLAQRNERKLGRYAELGLPIVGSEPSCILTFRDEFPHFVRSEGAKRIAAATQTVEQFLAGLLEHAPEAIRWREPAGRAGRVLFHGHCHQKAQIGTVAAHRLAAAIPSLAFSEINSGCCGMAGSFGHEKAHYDVARAVGAQRLFPAVAERGDAEIAVCGFSCREQIQHHCGVHPRHLLELAADALA